jgi:hypothetical protein
MPCAGQAGFSYQSRQNHRSAPHASACLRCRWRRQPCRSAFARQPQMAVPLPPVMARPLSAAGSRALSRGLVSARPGHGQATPLRRTGHARRPSRSSPRRARDGGRYLPQTCAPSATRTRDLPLRRQSRARPGHRSASACIALTCGNSRPGIAPYRPHPVGVGSQFGSQIAGSKTTKETPGQGWPVHSDIQCIGFGIQWEHDCHSRHGQP